MNEKNLTLNINSLIAPINLQLKFYNFIVPILFRTVNFCFWLDVHTAIA